MTNVCLVTPGCPLPQGLGGGDSKPSHCGSALGPDWRCSGSAGTELPVLIPLLEGG